MRTSWIVLPMMVVAGLAQAALMYCDRCGVEEIRALAERHVRPGDSMLVLDREQGRYSKYTLWTDGSDHILLQGGFSDAEKALMQCIARLFRQLNGMEQVRVDELPLPRGWMDAGHGLNRFKGDPVARKALENAVSTWITDQLTLKTGALLPLREQYQALAGKPLLDGYEKTLWVVQGEGRLAFRMVGLEHYQATGITRLNFVLDSNSAESQAGL